MVLLNDFIRAYIEAMLWSSHDDETPLDHNYGLKDISDEALQKIEKDCTRFIELADSYLIEDNLLSNYDLEAQAGHDFWLTRCGHGSGFWDGDWKEPAATALTKLSESFGNLDPYVGDDNKIYT